LSGDIHPAAIAHLPVFIPGSDSSDWLMVSCTLSLTIMVLAVGVLFFKLHTLPERLAHKHKRLQVEIVSVLGLISLFTHENAFWIAGLLLAFIDLPDVKTPYMRIVHALETIAAKTKTGDEHA